MNDTIGVAPIEGNSICYANGELYIAGKDLFINGLYEFAKISWDGTILNSFSVHVEQNGNVNSPAVNSLVHMNGKFYYAVGVAQPDSFEQTRMIVLEIASDFSDTVATYSFESDSTLCAIQPWKMVADSDSTLLMCGICYVGADTANTGLFDIWVARFDTNMNLLWETVIADSVVNQPYGDYGTSILVDGNGHVVVAGNTYRPFTVFYFSSHATRLDQVTGEVKWTRTYPFQFGGSGMFVVSDSTGGYSYVSQNWTNSPGVNVINVGRLDTATGDVLSQAVLTDPGRLQAPRDVLRSRDGSILIAGIGYYRTQYGFLLRTNEMGDTIAYRELSLEDTVGVREHNVESLIEREDGSIVIGGSHFDPFNGGWRYWLVGLDQYGCDTADCSIGLEDAAWVEHPQLLAYPNPVVEDVLTIRLSGMRSSESCTWALYNATGQTLLKGAVQASQELLELSLHGFSKGLYHFVLLNGNGAMVREKILLP